MAEIKNPKPFTHLKAITSIDGRFRGRTESFSDYFSEYAMIKGRVFVEVEYLIAFLKKTKQPATHAEQRKLRQIANNFSEEDAEWVFKKDEEINHDTKAVEYFLANRLKKINLEKYINFLHIGLTSTDIDNTALSLSLKKFNQKLFMPTLESLINILEKLAKEYKSLVMLGRTHGQIALPTTAGAELEKFCHRLKVQLQKLSDIKIGSKISGAVGNHNALYAAYPTFNWQKFSERFLKSLALEYYPFSTQVEPYEHKVEFIQAIKRVNYVTIALNEDLWRYLALGYLSLRDDKGHVGSSTMPQKINPIGFELSESYSTLANAIFCALEEKLPQNRWQRDLTDKYLLRDLGQALAMSYLSYESTADALKQIGFNKGVIEKDLDNHWESIAEGIQTILRTTKYIEPYEKLKELTRGKVVTKESYEKFINEIDVDKKTKEKLKKLSPDNYVGYAKKF